MPKSPKRQSCSLLWLNAPVYWMSSVYHANVAPQGSFLPRAIQTFKRFVHPFGLCGTAWRRLRLDQQGSDECGGPWKGGTTLLTNHYRCGILPLQPQMNERNKRLFASRSILAVPVKTFGFTPAWVPWTIEEWKAEQQLFGACLFLRIVEKLAAAHDVHHIYRHTNSSCHIPFSARPTSRVENTTTICEQPSVY